MATVFAVGDFVQLVGLLSNPSLNGAIGTVIGDIDETRGRYAINLKSPAAAVAAHPAGMSLKPLNLMKLVECARPGCDQLGTKGCSACSKEFYCSADCQKTNWKSHKPFCLLIKCMPVALLPLKDVYSTVDEVLKQTEAQVAKIGKDRYIRLLQHAATFTKSQFGKRVKESASYSRDDGDCVDAWNVEINVLNHIYNKLGYQDSSNRISYYQKSLKILGPWIEQICLSEGDRTNIFDEEQISYLYDSLSKTESNLSAGYREIRDWDKAKYYQEQSILHAKLMKEGEDKIKSVFYALSKLASLHNLIGKLPETKAVREEAYIYVSEQYNPEHPLVLEAGGALVHILNQTGDFYDAERFARICYEGLTRAPSDPDSFEAAKAARNLANASCNLICKNGPDSADIEEAEMLAKKAVRIMKELKGPVSSEMINAFQALVNVLMIRKNSIDETKNLLENYLSDAIRYQGVDLDGKSTGYANNHFGYFHRKLANISSCDHEKRHHLRLTESYFKEASRIFIKHYGLNHPNVLLTKKDLSEASIALERMR
jgi:hypothetical protein